MPWSSAFEDPIALPDGRKLLTLEDAANYITKLPEAEHTAPEWQAAMESLIGEPFPSACHYVIIQPWPNRVMVT
jgi:hypothetical protein